MSCGIAFGFCFVVISCRVPRGTIISSVGDTTLYETVADTHLHLELMKDEEHIDPLEYFDLK